MSSSLGLCSSLHPLVNELLLLRVMLMVMVMGSLGGCRLIAAWTLRFPKHRLLLPGQRLCPTTLPTNSHSWALDPRLCCSDWAGRITFLGAVFQSPLDSPGLSLPSHGAGHSTLAPKISPIPERWDRTCPAQVLFLITDEGPHTLLLLLSCFSLKLSVYV